MRGKPQHYLSRVRSKTPPEGYSVFLSYESSTCKTALERPRVPFSNASLPPKLHSHLLSIFYLPYCMHIALQRSQFTSAFCVRILGGVI